MDDVKARKYLKIFKLIVYGLHDILRALEGGDLREEQQTTQGNNQQGIPEHEVSELEEVP